MFCFGCEANAYQASLQLNSGYAVVSGFGMTVISE